MKIQKTFSAKPTDITRQWYLIDASHASLGRLSTRVAELLIGKGKANYSPNLDGGDYVVIINSDKLVTTGNKSSTKTYYHHSDYPGGLKSATLQERMEKGDSAGVIKDSVKGMLPKNKLQDGRLLRLKVYRGENHNHQAQDPKKVEVK